MPDINVRVVSGGGQQCNLEIDNSELGESLMALVEVEMGVPIHHQRLIFQGAALKPNLTLQAQGLTGDSTIQLAQQATSTPPQQSRNIEADVAQLFSGGAAPAAAGAAAAPAYQPSTTGNPTVDQQVANLFRQPATTQVDMRNQLSHLMANQPPPLDPMDPEYQRKMYEAIQQKNMEENLMHAMEHTPEAFAKVVMLYVNATVNKEQVHAFVDSGAQMTIMNEATAERCGLMRLLDRRFAGMAKGVGTSRILGRIHMAQVELGGEYIPMSITVLESQDMEFLIGLDQLRRHRMCIDLDKNCLRLDTVQIPFLSEGELPKRYRTDPEEEAMAESRGGGGDSSGGANPSSSTPPPPARNQQTAAGQSPAGGEAADPHKEGKVQRLMQLSGSTRPVVEQALDACDGNEDAAANLLFE